MPENIQVPAYDKKSSVAWRILRSGLFLLDAETAHHLVLQKLKAWQLIGRGFLSQVTQSSGLTREFWGIQFPNPVGLAAGFDKNGECLLAWQGLGFGYVEVGTVTALAQEGNPKPRIFRLPQDHALLNRLGFNNVGAKAVAHNIEKQRKDSRLKIPIGINIGKSKVVALEDAPNDYARSFTMLADLADYVVINVSSPNTPGLRDLQAPQALEHLLEVLCNENKKRQIPKPLLLKLAPDLPLDEAISCGMLAVKMGLMGLVISNTSIDREGLLGAIPEGPGGISGQPLFSKSTQMLKALRREFGAKLNFIGVGGVMSAREAKSKFEAGADLIQVYTGFVYGGPFFVKKILKLLVDNYEL